MPGSVERASVAQRHPFRLRTTRRKPCVRMSHLLQNRLDAILTFHIQLFGLVTYFYDYEKFSGGQSIKNAGQIGICQTDKNKSIPDCRSSV